MSYSCSDFVDSVLDALSIELHPDDYDSPSAQADLALSEIASLQAQAQIRQKHGSNPARITAAIDHLKIARDLLRQAGAGRAADYVARSMKSAEGALRHAQNMQHRAIEAPRQERVS